MTNRARLALWVAFGFAIVVQLVVLYVPSAPSGPGIPGFDKLVHAGIFLVPAVLGVLAGARVVWLAAVLAVHAFASEALQHLLLPERAGDVWDVVADLAGLALGLAIGLGAQHLARGRRRDAAHRGAP
ncbi:VanZ family protein [Agromyces aerolatus]|uniref:VanZ family protein n=1 Tax=Agromyces sp. LY-1074 TaxID=3074080 RepID=UPI0028543780|nr:MULTISPECIES: VanZ family protein [unclassified Agromyces]MDR5699386.1 VanZ family protein [Agromyces sp. LY-1074]MDR5705682.1 VanZ family protein [Agromyces sp. LY-1358]